MIRNVNPQGLAWPDYWFQPGFKQHLSHEEGMRMFEETLAGVYKRFQEQLQRQKQEQLTHPTQEERRS